jgi:SHS family lactate transporter-like MFS transporter
MVRVTVSPSVSFTVKQTVPTGLSSVPPPGPAIPVIAIAVSAAKRLNAPSAIASATGSDTAPFAAIRSGSTPSSSVFASFAYATTLPAT